MIDVTMDANFQTLNVKYFRSICKEVSLIGINHRDLEIMLCSF